MEKIIFTDRQVLTMDWFFEQTKNVCLDDNVGRAKDGDLESVKNRIHRLALKIKQETIAEGAAKGVSSAGGGGRFHEQICRVVS